MESKLIVNKYMELWMYKAVENCGVYCGGKCTHVDKNGLKLFFKCYTQTMLGFIRGCEQFIGVWHEVN